MARKSFPLPTRNPATPDISDVAWVSNTSPTLTPEQSAYFEQAWEKARRRIASVEAKTFAAQYFAVEARLLGAFPFVSPASTNRQAYSIEFASVIKEACNLFELVAKAVYARFYDIRDDLNIYNYLSLDAELDFAKAQLKSILLHDTFDDSPEVLAPFVRLRSWGRNAPVEDAHTPLWWKAYNNLKHSNDGLAADGTMANALAALAGALLLVHRVYGPGLILGQLRMEGFGWIDAPGSKIFMSRSSRSWVG